MTRKCVAGSTRKKKSSPASRTSSTLSHFAWLATPIVSLWSISVSADAKRLLTSSTDKTLRLWDADTGKCLRVFEGHTECIESSALSPDGKRVLSGGSHDTTMRLWDADTGKELLKISCHTDKPFDIAGVLGVAFGPDGQALSCGCDGTARLWDLSTGKQLRLFKGHERYVYKVAYSDKANLVATASPDQSIRPWNLETGKE